MENTPKVSKSNHKLVAGHAAEESAVKLLLSKGYKIIARNVRYKAGELDIVAKDGDALCFVEVRSRQNQKHSNPKSSVRNDKQTKLIRAAMLYLQKNFRGARPPCRFDVIGVTGYGPGQQLELIKHAFELKISPRRSSGNPWQAY